MKRFVRLVGLLLAILLLAAVALPFLIDANTFRPALEAKLSEALARPVKLGNLKLSLFSGAVSAAELSIADDPAFSKEPFVQARSLDVGVEMLPLILSKKLNVTRVVIDEPRVTLLQSAAGVWNFASLGRTTAAPAKPAPSASEGKPLDLAVKLIKIDNGRFAVNKLALEKVNAELRDFSASTASPFSFRATVAGGGKIDFEGKAGPIDDRDASRTPLSASLKIDQLDLAAAHWMPGGIATLDGSLKSDGKTAVVTGKLDAEKLKLAERGTPADRPVSVNFAAEHRLADSAGRVSKGDLRIGNAAARLTGAYTRTALRFALDGDSMPVPELASMLPALGIALPAGSSLQSGTASVKLAMEGPSDRLVTAGTIAVKDTTWGGFDLGRKLAVVAALAGMSATPSTKIETLGATIRMTHEGTSADDLALTVQSIGELTGAGTISPANALDFHMSAKVGGINVPLLVGGTTADPSFRPDVKSVVSEKAKGVAGGLLNRFLGGKKK